MALFTTEEQTSAYAKDPDYYKGSGFVLGLMGYKPNGQKSTFGKIKDVALPVLGGVGGFLVGGPAGAAIGSSLGQGLNAASNRAAEGIVGGAMDSQANIDNDLTGTLARGQLGMSLGQLAGGVAGGVQKGQGVGDIFKGLEGTAKNALPDVAQGLAGAIGANSLNTTAKRGIRYFKGGGAASPGFAARFAAERARQGAGGEFSYNGKKYNTYFKEEVRPGTQTPITDVAVERTQPGLQTGEVPAMENFDLSGFAKKPGVALDNINPVLGGYLNSLPAHLRRFVTITSGTDSAGIHSKKSKHGHGDALDLRYNPELYAHIASDPLAIKLGLKTIDPNHGTAPHIHLQYSGQNYAGGGEVKLKKPFTYKYGGMTFTVDKPTDYTVYGKGDKTEDITMMDTKTGKSYGAMRYGERIFDQHSSLAMRAIMGAGIGKLQKQAALGEHVYNELLTHKNSDGTREFAGGGEAGPGDDRKKLLEQIAKLEAEQQTYELKKRGESKNQARTNAQRQAAASDEFKARERSRLLGEAKKVMDTVHYGGYQPLLGASNEDKLAKARRLIDSASNQGTPASTPRTPAVAPKPMKPPTQYYEKPSAPLPTPAPGKSAIPGVPSRAAMMGAGVGKPAPNVSAIGRPVIDTPKPIAGSDQQDFNQAFAALSIAKSKDPIADPLNARIPGLNADIEKQRLAGMVKPEVKPYDASNLASNLLDVGRIVTGAVMASKKTPVWSPPAQFTQYQSELASRKNQGYAAPEWNAINGQIADNYSAGQTALTNSLGSGSTPGLVLAGLTRLNQQRAASTSGAMLGDVSRRAQNFGAYGNSVQQGLQLDRQLFDDNLSRVVSGQQGGVSLAGAALQNIQQRKLYDDNYGPSSLYNRLMKSQADKEDEAAQTLKAMRKAAITP